MTRKRKETTDQMFQFNRKKEVRISNEQMEHLIAEQEIRHKQMEENLKREQKNMYQSWIAHMEELLQVQQKKQENVSNAVEDLLDEWSERNELAEEYKEQLENREECTKQFLSLVQLLLLQNRLLQNEIERMYSQNDTGLQAWKQQAELLEQQTRNAMSQCQIQLFGAEGQAVDGACHQVLEAIDTDDPTKHSRIAKVHEPGILYQGNVIKKATVTAYK